MTNTHDHAGDSPAPDDAVERIVAQGPRGALALAGVSVLILLAIWLGFYFFVFLPRGVLH